MMPALASHRLPPRAPGPYFPPALVQLSDRVALLVCPYPNLSGDRETGCMGRAGVDCNNTDHAPAERAGVYYEGWDGALPMRRPC